MHQWVHRLRSGRPAPFLLTCEHAGKRLPAGIETTRQDRIRLGEHWGWDPGAWALTRALSRSLGAPAVGARFSRLWIDPNRHPADPTLIRREIEGTPVSFNARLSTRKVLERLRNFHAAYHDELDAALVRQLLAGVRPWIVAVHSFTPMFAGRPRGFDYGLLYDGDRGPAFRLARAMRDRGLPVRYNQPYSGRKGLMYSADRHGRHHGLINLELEVSQGRLAEPGFPEWLSEILAGSLTEARGTDS